VDRAGGSEIIEDERDEPLSEHDESKDRELPVEVEGEPGRVASDEAGSKDPDSGEEGGGQTVADELEQVSAQAAEYLDGWQRARAELANYKKRVERERKEAYSRAAGDILAQFLDVVDDLERALKGHPAGEEASNWVQGVELVHRKMKSILDAYAVEPIEATGQPFDPNLHEAISHEETDQVPAGYVIDVVKQGYRMGDRVLRPATVRVAK
jgi:molecular chaperone GrpE